MHNLRKRNPPKNGHDELCAQCDNVGLCLNPCLPLKWIDGNVSRKEALLAEPINDRQVVGNYNDVLYSMMQEHDDDEVRIEKIRNIPDARIRLIAAGFHARLTVPEIAHSLSMSTRQLYRVLRQATGTNP